MREPKIMCGADGSINYVWEFGDGKAMEARYVRRTDDEVIVYLSSQLGCRQGCRMCHLTRTGQTSDETVDLTQFLTQAYTVLNDTEDRGLLMDARTVNFNFMARGEPLLNPAVNADLLGSLTALAGARSLIPRFKISTILPKGFRGDLVDRFPIIHPDIYYSIYSVAPEFRKRWLPNAMPVSEALAILRRWQQHTHKIPKIHFALIKGENDSLDHLVALVAALHDLRVDVNIVRYNPHETDETEEGDYVRAATRLSTWLKDSNVQIVERVGCDVKASCGMFVEAGL